MSACTRRTILVLSALLPIVIWGVFRLLVEAYIQQTVNDRRFRGGPDGLGAIASDESALIAVLKRDAGSAASSSISRPGVLLVPEGTKAEVIDRKLFSLKNGRFEETRRITLAEMRALGLIEVEKVRILEGPMKGREGWAPAQDLGGTVAYP